MPWRLGLVLTFLLAGCGWLIENPPVTCESLVAEDCARAVDMARPLLGAYWEQAGEVRVHPGACSESRSCSPRFATNPGFITVELVSDQSEAALVVIERHADDWTAMCSVTVRTENGAHGEPCSASPKT